MVLYVIEVLKGIFVNGRKFKVFRIDKGSEFKNWWVFFFLEKEGVY